MTEGVKREQLAYGPAGAEDEAEVQARLLEHSAPQQIGTTQVQSSPEALERQKKIKEFTERGEMLNKEIAELEEIVMSGVKVDPAGGASDSANEEYPNRVDGDFQGLVKPTKRE